MTHFRQIVLLVFTAVLLTACSTVPRHHGTDTPETVLVIYHVKAGKEAELEKALSDAWELYRKEHLVFAEPHLVIRAKEEGENFRYSESFTWVSHEAPDHVPASIKAVWNVMQSLCEKRGGPERIEIREVELILPRTH